MARPIFKLTAPLFYFFFLSLLSQKSMSQRQHLRTFCDPSNNFTQTSSYEANLKTLLSDLRESSSLGTYSNATIGLSPDTVYGMYLCRGDTPKISCEDCVRTATIEIATNCTLNKEAVTYYQKCMVRYSNVSFITLMETSPRIGLAHNISAPNLNQFNQTLSDKFNQLIQNVSFSSSIPYFVEDQERVNQPEGSYELESMIQCSPDLNLFNCTACLQFAFFRVSTCCATSPRVFQIFTPKCLLRYETTVLPSPPPLSLPPPTQLSPPPSLVQMPPPPLLFTRPPNVPSPGGSFSFNIIKGNKILARIVVILMVFALVDL